MSRPFPTDHPFLTGPWEPWPMEGEIRDAVVEGEIPRGLRGTLYRNGPNQQFAPRDRYHPFGGDGMIHAFAIEDGKCHYRNRWVRTPKFEAERQAGESLFSSFGSATPGDPRAEGVLGGPSNTNVVWHAGRLLSLVEGGLPPVELDPATLETRGVFEFGGALRRRIDPEVARALGIESPDGKGPGIFTAHPKLDPQTGEMLGFGYSAVAPFLVYYAVSQDGRITRSEEIEIPFPAMIHDFITTRDFVIFPIFPATLRVERLAEGKDILGWEPDLGTRIGVLPRSGGNADVVWLDADPSFVFHPMNAHGRGRRIVAEMAQYERLPIPAEGNDPALLAGAVPATLVRWHLDLDAGTVKQEPLDDRSIEFPRLDERRAGLPYRWGYAAGQGDVGSGMHAILRYDLETGAVATHRFDPTSSASEPVFVPREPGAPEGAGWLLSVVYSAATGKSDLAILDAEDLEAPPRALVKLPHRVPAGFHGNWRAGE